MLTKFINGKHKTKDQAVVDNMGLVRQQAQKYAHIAKQGGLEFEDLESIGAIALMKAFDAFDESKGLQFSTYAVTKIMGEITRAIQYSSDKEIRYPANVKAAATKILKEGLENESVEAIADLLSFPKSRVKLAMEYIHMKGAIRLDHTADNQEEGASFHELIGTGQDLSNVVVNDFLLLLTEKEKQVVELLMQGYGTTDVGKRLGFSRSYVGTYLPGIKDKLKKYLAGTTVNPRKEIIMEQTPKLGPIEATEERYNELRAAGLKNEEIAEKMQLKAWKLYELKKQWDNPELQKKGYSSPTKAAYEKLLREKKELEKELKELKMKGAATVPKEVVSKELINERDNLYMILGRVAVKYNLL